MLAIVDSMEDLVGPGTESPEEGMAIWLLITIIGVGSVLISAAIYVIVKTYAPKKESGEGDEEN